MKEQLYTLKVARVDELAKTYVVEYEDKMYRVHMVPEQLGKGNPGEIVCTIEKSQNSYIITQDMETLLRRHYQEGDEVVYRIEKVTSSYYFLKDEYGYSTYLGTKYKINPTITPKLRCRIKSINSKRVNVELVEKISLERSQFTIGADYLRSLFEPHIACSDSVVRLLLADEIIGSFDSECHIWIHSIYQDGYDSREKLFEIRDACLSVLEASPMLGQCNENEREVLEKRFTILIEQLGYYIKALDYVAAGEEEETIDLLLKKLQVAGYVFHPKKYFYVMMCIFIIKSKDADGLAFTDRMMPRIFDTLRSCNIDNWKRKPFKLVWIKLLEFFIQSLRRDQDKLLTDKTALANIAQALALQFNLAKEDDELLIDSVLNLSLLYRCCIRVGVVNPEQMLDVTYHTLIGAIQEEPNMITNTSDPDRMACIVCNQVSQYTPSTTTSLKYEGKNADILLDNTSIRIVPKDTDDEDTYDQVPEYLGLWNQLQVELPTKPSPIGKVNRKLIRPYKSLWNSIERSLLTPPKKKEKKEERLPLGDQVGIIVTKQLAAETPTFECRVVDPVEYKATGTIRMADMVGYATPTVGLFSFEKEGQPLIFDAIACEEREDGTYRFEARELIDEFCTDYRYYNIGYTDHVYCVVTGGNTLTSFYAVSEQGIPTVVRYSDGETPIPMEKGTVIEVTCLEGGKSGFMGASFCRLAPEKTLTLADAFGTLVGLLSGGDTYQEETEEDEDAAPDIIEKPRIRELMNIIVHEASLDNDYIKAYNYLGFSKMIAHIIEDEKQALYYDSKMQLIELLCEFDINNSLSEEQIDRYQATNGAFFSQHSTLYRLFRKLQIVSYMGSEAHNRELCDVACDPGNTDLAQLAQLVISYNFMQNTNMPAQALDVQEHIKELLKLQKKDNPKKDYGQETFTKEFKTSIVTPAGTMHPDPARQTHKIMEEICAFLNAEGGELYIGVDDKTHLERGIEEDLKHSLFEGSKDKYDTYVRNKINQMLVPGEMADHYISTSFDEEAQTPVYVISIRPCPQPVSIDGVFYERRGTSARHVSEEYMPTFINNRLQMASTIEQARIDEVISASQAETKPEPKPEEAKKESRPFEYTTHFDDIKTSQVRAFRHKDDEIQPDDLTVFINIFEDNTYSVTPQTLSGCLSIGIYDEEQEQGALVVVYSTGEISKIPIKELLDTEQWVQKNIHNKSKIVFVSPAMPEEVLSVLYHSKNNDYYRFITVDTLDHGTFNTCMRPFYTGQIDEILECEIVSVENRNVYKNFIDISSDKAGADTKKTDGKKAAALIRQMSGRDI